MAGDSLGCKGKVLIGGGAAKGGDGPVELGVPWRRVLDLSCSPVVLSKEDSLRKITEATAQKLAHRAVTGALDGME